MTSRTDGEERRDRYSSASSLQLSLPPSSLPTCHPPQRAGVFLCLTDLALPTYGHLSVPPSFPFVPPFSPLFLPLCPFAIPHGLFATIISLQSLLVSREFSSYLAIVAQNFPSSGFLNAAFFSSLPFPLHFASLSLLLISLNCSASSCSQRVLCTLPFYQFMFISLVLLSAGSPFESRADADKTSLGHNSLFIPTFRITSTELRSTWPALITWYG